VPSGSTESRFDKGAALEPGAAAELPAGVPPLRKDEVVLLVAPEVEGDRVAAFRSVLPDRGVGRERGIPAVGAAGPEVWGLREVVGWAARRDLVEEVEENREDRGR
jgi:hypothetical protein